MDSRATNACRICGDHGPHALISAQERQFGMGDKFTYLQCGHCGTVQIAEIPQNLGHYYPTNYYSFEAPDAEAAQGVTGLRRFLRARRTDFQIAGRDPVGWAISKLGADYFPYSWQWFRQTDVRADSKILDVGCGGGKLLRTMRQNGFTRLYGVDPFVPEPIKEESLQIAKGEIFDLQDQFDLVMFHHSLEHVPDPERHLQAAKKLCRPGGAILVRLPLSDGHGWRTYQDRWFPLDAPRHIFIPTKKSMHILAGKCGMDIAYMEHDTKAFCFLNSELYRRDLPIFQPDGRQTIDVQKIFSPEDHRKFDQLAHDVNARGEGDLGCFVLRSR